jgi:hypothetical protein
VGSGSIAHPRGWNGFDQGLGRWRGEGRELDGRTVREEYPDKDKRHEAQLAAGMVLRTRLLSLRKGKCHIRSSE